MSNEWHNLRKNPLDVPKKDGHYEAAIIRRDGAKRIYNNAFYRTKTKRMYTHQNGRNIRRDKPKGWNFSDNANVMEVVACREKANEEEVFG